MNAGSFDFAAYRRAADQNEAAYRTLDALAWPDEHRIAVNVTADFDAMLLRRLLNEPSMQRAKGEFGGRTGIWRLLELFERHDIQATIFTPGRIAELYPDAIIAASEAGHEIADHMWEHQVPKDADVERSHLLRAADAIEKLTGKRPVGTRSWHTPKLLNELGYIYNSHLTADTLPYYTSAHGGEWLLNLPFHWSVDDAMYFSFAWLNTDGPAQRITDPDRVLEMWWSAFRQQYDASGYFNICLHPFVSGHAMRIDMLDELIGRMKALPGVWFPTCEDVARHAIAAFDAKGAN
ncbi:MAG: polysaccharide deacetylase family protein [Rhodobacteraceae bacterium]|nr:polysaccharide deacetylase family protein [Paracoccaceae bacterium]